MDKSIYSRQYAALLRVLRSKREESGVTQVELADKLGMTQSAYSKLERGELRLDVIQLRSISNQIGVSLTEFVTDLEQEICKPNTKKTQPKSRRK